MRPSTSTTGRGELDGVVGAGQRAAVRRVGRVPVRRVLPQARRLKVDDQVARHSRGPEGGDAEEREELARALTQGGTPSGYRSPQAACACCSWGT